MTEIQYIQAINYLVEVEKFTLAGAKDKYYLWLKGKYTIEIEKIIL